MKCPVCKTGDMRLQVSTTDVDLEPMGGDDVAQFIMEGMSSVGAHLVEYLENAGRDAVLFCTSCEMEWSDLEVGFS